MGIALTYVAELLLWLGFGEDSGGNLESSRRCQSASAIIQPYGACKDRGGYISSSRRRCSASKFVERGSDDSDSPAFLPTRSVSIQPVIDLLHMFDAV